MSSEYARLRRLVNEELNKLDEYRPNTFMLSRMEEKEKTDQDGDGDNDFDDVRVARYTKGGMSREKALAKVRRKPMGDGGKAREAAGLAELIMGMTLRERRALHESVKRRILLEGDAPPATPAPEPEPSDDSPTGARLMKGDIEFFRKTDSGWKATLRLTLPQILSIIKPEYQPEVKKDLTALGDRAELLIAKGYLKNPSMSFMDAGLTFQRDGELFADPVAVPGDKMAGIASNLDLEYDESKKRAVGPADAAESEKPAWAVGNVIFKRTEADKMTITVQDDGSGEYTDFNSIFGARADVPRLIQKAAKKSGGKVDLIKIPLRFADESSLMGNFGGFLGMGAIKFEKVDDNKFVCTLERPALVERAVEVLDGMSDAGVNRARKLETPSSK